MYTPRAFVETDLVELDRLFARDPFVTLVTTDAQGLPFASHLPVLYAREGRRVRVEGHWARPNPQAGGQCSALMIVHGPQAYISPGWYTDKESAARVPTWNYAVAHLYGELQRFDTRDELGDLVDRLSRRFEADVGGDWRFDARREDHATQLRGIVGFRFVPDRIELKFKLNQNHPVTNVHGAAAGLRALGRKQAVEVAGLMLERLQARSGD